MNLKYFHCFRKIRFLAIHFQLTIDEKIQIRLNWKLFCYCILA